MPVDWGQIAQVGMGLASQYANSRSQARTQAANQQQTQNAQAISQNQGQNNVLLQMAQIELLRKQFEQSNRQANASQTARGDLMANVQDARFSRPAGVPNISLSGGIRPSALGPNARAAGAELSNRSLADLMSGESFMPINPRGPVDLDATMPQESGFDKIMGLVGAAGGAYQGYQQMQQGQQQQSFMNDLLKQMQEEQQKRDYAAAVRQFGGMGLP